MPMSGKVDFMIQFAAGADLAVNKELRAAEIRDTGVQCIVHHEIMYPVVKQ